MNRRKFIGIATGTIAVAGVSYYLMSDKRNFVRSDIAQNSANSISILPVEREILFLASLAPSGHNTQPWFVQYVEPYHWIIGNDQSKWLPAVDPTQRETILSIGAFIQNLEYAASSFGFSCAFNLLATHNQDPLIMDVKLKKNESTPKYDVQQIKLRRTVRSNYLNQVLKGEDIHALVNGEEETTFYLPNTTKEHKWLNEQTIEANRAQTYRDAAQEELANWMRFSSKTAATKCDGLTTASMEIEGIPGWVLRNFYDKENVLKKNFREQSIDKVAKQVTQSAGWLLITSKDKSVATLLETGQKFQRIFLKIRKMNIAIHPMTQILEEEMYHQQIPATLGINNEVQFILRTGYLNDYPAPVSLRRPIDRFLRT
jgi:hypothetical protein